MAEYWRLNFYDQRGVGRSTGLPAESSDTATVDFRTFVQDLETLRRSLELEELTLLGHSWGGLIAMGYAVTHPGRVAVVDSVFRNTFRPWLGDPSLADQSSFGLDREAAERGRRAARLASRNIRQVLRWANLPDIRAPTLILHGERDPIPMEMARELEARVPGARERRFLPSAKEVQHVTDKGTGSLERNEVPRSGHDDPPGVRKATSERPWPRRS